MIFLLTTLKFDFERNIDVFELNCDFLMLIFNEIFMGLPKWQHIKSYRDVKQNKLPCIQLSLILQHSKFEVLT